MCVLSWMHGGGRWGRLSEVSDLREVAEGLWTCPLGFVVLWFWQLGIVVVKPLLVIWDWVPRPGVLVEWEACSGLQLPS
jgi:hypothetical protein